MEDVKGTEPVNSTTRMARVKREIPKDLEKYSSRSVSFVSYNDPNFINYQQY
jgi:hypothetical protein